MMQAQGTPTVRTARILRPNRELAPATQALGDCLAELQAAMQGLLDVARDKLQAMRAANVEVLRDCALREEDLIKEVVARQQARDAVLTQLAQALPLEAQRAKQLRDLMVYLPEPEVSALRARSVALGRVASELHEKNKLAEQVAQKLQSHIRGVFQAAARSMQESVVYGSKGVHQTSATRRCVDAVG
jgi:flagellar biosynthesis/type III secretory pathway chaperone